MVIGDGVGLWFILLCQIINEVNLVIQFLRRLIFLFGIEFVLIWVKWISLVFFECFLCYVEGMMFIYVCGGGVVDGWCVLSVFFVWWEQRFGIYVCCVDFWEKLSEMSWCQKLRIIFFDYFLEEELVFMKLCRNIMIYFKFFIYLVVLDQGG